MNSNDQNKKGQYPLMRIPRREISTSEIEEKLADLGDFILQHVYPFFMWYGSITKRLNDEIRSILFLEGLFLQMLVSIKDISQMRGKKLCNENVCKFKDILTELNEKMRNGTKYIRRSNHCLEDELNSGTSCVASMRQDVVLGFRELSGWLQEELQKPGNKERAEALADELDLDYDMRMYGCFGDNFEQHTNMVLNGLMLLSLPSMPDTQNEDFCDLFDNSIAEMQANESVKLASDSWKKKISRECDLNRIVEDEEKVVYLKKIWKAVDEQEQAFLDGFDIVADNTRSTTEKATMGFRIYHNLNMDEVEDSPRMETADLQQYLLFVIQKQYLDEEIERLKPNSPGKKAAKRRLFRQYVDQEHLKACLNEVYNRFYTVDDKDKIKLESDFNDLLTIMVYLYIICEMEGLFENADKGPFFKFCIEEVGFETDKTDRTFRNRFKELKKVHEKYCEKPSLKLNERTENDFQRVLRIFRGKRNYDKLRRDMMG